MKHKFSTCTRCFNFILQRNKINIPEAEIRKLVKLYWETITKNVTLISGAEELLKNLKNKYDEADKRIDNFEDKLLSICQVNKDTVLLPHDKQEE